ncbi:hypothetical protein BKA67DRAFT_697270 [Truncatella angustata]|uniref:Uncharacterized protein n=1 Tax=Truncatella angustata TaxID=152316 RepID=A0A9P8UAI5_9PEZI|nr:uncharacterized protein BKA67DRAFT_697270 [Truncatella angustata]KAH6638528.1 hypothetical protein BKA67DRAFT_697270 [Truncatella angustata]
MSHKHMRSVERIVETLLSRDSPKHVYYIQISGASVLVAGELASKSFVPWSPSDATFDDYEGATKLRELIRAYPSRAVDNYILELAAEFQSVQTALIFPPVIYGQGQG